MEPRLFFVHVMKTGGATFRRHVEAQVGVDRVYPNAEADEDLFKANTSVRYLQSLSKDRWDRVDVVAAHLPFFASMVLERPFVTATILRDPVERTVSHLRHCQRYDPRHRDSSLETIYDDPWVFPMQIHNHQVRVFALRPSDGADTIRQPIEVDDDRLKQAMDHVARVDLLGLHDDYDEFVDTVHRRFGWERQHVPSWHVSSPAEIPEHLLHRIRDDNAADIEFFEHVKDLHRSAGG